MKTAGKTLGLYIHIPFCKCKCAYCDFYSLAGSEGQMGDYTEALCTHLGFALENAMAFGDGTNDTCMIKAAGMGVAMSNAEKEVLAAADYITLSNNEAGVAAAIERFVLS